MRKPDLRIANIFKLSTLFNLPLCLLPSDLRSAALARFGELNMFGRIAK